MSLSDLDLQLGQLALARGVIDLFELLECTSEAARQSQGDLEEALIETGNIDPAEIRTLREDIERMDSAELDDMVQESETIVLRSLAASELDDRETLVEQVMDPVEVAQTLATSPEEATTGTEESTAMPPVMPDTTAALEDGGDRYEIIDELGRGGMGQILRARDRLLGRQIALKTVLPDSSIDETRRQLMAEARLTGKLEHPSIVPVYEVGTLSNDEPYYTMRVVPEHSLRGTIQQLRSDVDDAPSMLRLAQILRQVCLAVHFAHEKGVIHRDLKPENILLGEYGEVFVIDWGIAKVLSDVEDVPSPATEEESVGSVIGTPQYMAPEQARGDNDQIDARTDIYAIGAILYELMTLTPVFSDGSVMGLLITIVQQQPEIPSERAPDRQIPEPLEEICLKALSKAPADRYPSAEALAEELSLYIEGVKDRERDERRARELIAEADEARRDYRQTRRRLQEAIARRNELRDSLPGWAEQKDRVELWEIEERVEQLETRLERKFSHTTRLLGQSLGHVELIEAHDTLASLYWERFTEAERRGDRQMATHFENLVRQHDTGAFTARLEGRAGLEIDVEPDSAKLTLYRVEEHHRRLLPRKIVDESHGMLQLDSIPHGRYRLVARGEGLTPVQLPIQLDRLDSRQIELRLRGRDAIPGDFVLIPGGEFITGPPDEFGVEQKSAELDDYAIQRTPVTCGEYVEFLNDLAEDDMERARRHAPRTGEDAESYFPVVDGRFVVPQADAEGDSWDEDWPICIVNYHDATAYADWRSKRDGRDYRLPTALEWEKAARGVDGRLYPWGNHFDASFCRMREGLFGKPVPAPVGTHRADVSPYGALDMAGNICEWTQTSAENTPETKLLCGGSYNSIALMCRVYWNQNSPPSFRHAHYGFRLALHL